MTSRLRIYVFHGKICRGAYGYMYLMHDNHTSTRGCMVGMSGAAARTGELKKR